MADSTQMSQKNLTIPKDFDRVFAAWCALHGEQQTRAFLVGVHRYMRSSRTTRERMRVEYEQWAAEGWPPHFLLDD